MQSCMNSDCDPNVAPMKDDEDVDASFKAPPAMKGAAAGAAGENPPECKQQ